MMCEKTTWKMSSFYEEDDNHSLLPRFLPDVNDIDNIKEYPLGGYHSVRLGDTYDDGRFRVVHKLGAGACTTYCLAGTIREREDVGQ
ncbi:hypothetical protein F4782DRAFT_481825 [Xylaria castorea]|nr:hypothetical protein F4782DRAFT_481825 [Xylaria castorea]